MNNNLDHLFKKALQDKSYEPPPYIWGNIERQLNKNKLYVNFIIELKNLHGREKIAQNDVEIESILTFDR